MAVSNLRVAAVLSAAIWATARTQAEVPVSSPDGLTASLSLDDECRGDATCSVNALQHTLTVKRAEAESERLGSCTDYGCADKYVKGRLCQCNAGCHHYGNCCKDVTDTCAGMVRHAEKDGHGPVMTLYHQTSPAIGKLILEDGFKPGRVGWCGGAIYFAENPQATRTKVVGIDSHQGFMLEAVVRLGRVKRMPSWCDQKMTGEKLRSEGYDSIVFNPIDGDEHVVFNQSQVLSVRRFPFSWR